MPSPTDRARERATRDSLIALLTAVKRVELARRGLPEPTDAPPGDVALLRLKLMRYAATHSSGAFMRDMRALLVPTRRGGDHGR